MEIKMLEYNKVAKIIISYVNEMLAAEEYLEKLPDDIYSFILENTYTSAVETALLQVLKTALGSDIYDDLMWFMSDTDENTISVTGSSGAMINYTIENLDDFLEYVRYEYY